MSVTAEVFANSPERKRAMEAMKAMHGQVGGLVHAR